MHGGDTGCISALVQLVADLNRVAYSIVKHNPVFKGLSVKTAAR